MSVRQIVTYPDERLRLFCEPLAQPDDELAQDLLDTCHAHNAAGLAAIQIGVPKQMVCVRMPQGLAILVNPKILGNVGVVASEEGCLSFPGVFEVVKAPEAIVVQYQNRDMGEVQTRSASGLVARAVYHEVSHCYGSLFIDRMSPMVRRMFLKRYEKVRRG